MGRSSARLKAREKLTANRHKTIAIAVGAAVLLGATACKGESRSSSLSATSTNSSTTVVTTASTPTSTAVIATAPQVVAPITKAELLNFSMPPEACPELRPGHHRLVNGEYSERGTNFPEGIRVEDVALGDLDGDGVGDGAFSFGCDYAGTFHITDVYVVRAVDRKALDVKLVVEHPEWPVFDARHESLNDVRELAIGSQKLTVTMEWLFQTEPTAGGSTLAIGTYRFQATGFVRQAISVTSDLTRTVELTAALNARDRAKVARMSEHPDFAEGFNREMDRAERFDFLGCPIPEPLTEPPTCQIQSVRDYGEGESGDPMYIRWVGSPDARRAQTV